MYSVKPREAAAHTTVVREALSFALEHAESPEKWIFPNYRAGLAGYGALIQAVEKGSAIRMGLAYNAAVWEECRRLGVDFLKEARATQEVAQSRYERGLADYLSVLEAQQTRFQAEENLVLVELAVLTNRVSLHRALGGGWGRPPAVSVKKQDAYIDSVPFLPMKYDQQER